MSDLFQMLVEAVRNTQRRPVNIQPVLIFAAQSEPKRKTHPPPTHDLHRSARSKSKEFAAGVSLSSPHKPKLTAAPATMSMAIAR
jgi:hypothetical protein